MLEFDPIANIFPMIEGKARDDFRADVAANGLLEKIVLRQGRVLDGRNRYLTLVHLGEVADDAPADMLLKHDGRFLDFDVVHPGKDPFDWVMSLNVHRRHLEPSQWAAVAANAETLKHGGNRKGQDANLQLDRASLSSTLNVSPRLIASAAKVKREGAPELFAAVEQGKVKATVAEGLLGLTKDRQIEAATMLDARRLPNLAKKVRRGERIQALNTKVRALPTKQYVVIYLDPATRFLTRSDNGDNRQPEYPTMTMDELKALPVGTLAAPHCAMFCWTTGPQLENTLSLLRFWGFTYVAQAAWDKTGSEGDDIPAPPGTGFWFRNDHELLILATKGNPPCPAPGDNWSSIHHEKKGEHSSKPLHFTLLIESYFHGVPRLEMFKRGEARPGWDYWGNEAPESIEQSSPEAANGGAVVEGEIPAAAGGGVEARINTPATKLLAAYEAAVAASPAVRGAHTRATAEPILRAAYAIEPPPIGRVVADTGANRNTVLSWAHRLKLSKTERRSSSGSAASRKARADWGGLNDAPTDEGRDRAV